MNNAELLVTVIKQAGVAGMEAEAIASAAQQNGEVLAHECVPALNIIVERLAQAHGAALELQQRAHGVPPAKLG